VSPTGAIRSTTTTPGGATDLIAEIEGNGGELSAPTQDIIATSEILRDQFLVPFSKSLWQFRFNGNLSNPPFTWVILNTTKSTDAPYGTVSYDERITCMGKQCFAVRFDTLNQTWMLYPSINAPTGKSDRVLIYNFLENTWATFKLSLSCMGTFFVSQGTTWADLGPGGMNPTAWEDADQTWASYLSQKDSPTLLGGGHTGIVSVLGTGVTDNKSSTDPGTAISASILSTRWNPFIDQGQKVQFGWIDIYYQRQNDCILTLSFFVNNSESSVLTVNMPCTTSTANGVQTNDNFGMKRVYLNLTGEFIRMSITSSSLSLFKISGLVLWAAPAGRLTP